MSSFVNDGNLEGYNCTYFVSGDHLLHQAIFTCHTCQGTNENCCCCAGCAAVCHEGHDVEFIVSNMAYCDCGKSNCILYQSTVDKYRNSLPERGGGGDGGESFLYGGDVPLSISDRPFEVHKFSAMNREILELAAQQCSSIVSHSKETFWVGCDWNYSSTSSQTNQPRCRLLLEDLALYIFNYHLQSLSSRSSIDLSFNHALSGAEWWIQIKDLTDPDLNSPSINLHYDKDEDIAENFDVGIFPSISTVTYFSEQTIHNSQPTVIFPTTINDPLGTEIRDCYLSYPLFGKHISFDGRLLHGAPANSQLRNWRHEESIDLPINEFNQQSTKRITFLVNIWLNHHPANIQPLPSSIIESIVKSEIESLPLNLELLPGEPSEISTHIIKGPTNTAMIGGDKKEINNPIEKILLPFVSKDTLKKGGEINLDQNQGKGKEGKSQEGEEEDSSELFVEMYLPPWSSCSPSPSSGAALPHSFHFKYHAHPAQIISTGEEEEWEDDDGEEEEV